MRDKRVFLRFYKNPLSHHIFLHNKSMNFNTLEEYSHASLTIYNDSNTRFLTDVNPLWNQSNHYKVLSKQ